MEPIRAIDHSGHSTNVLSQNLPSSLMEIGMQPKNEISMKPDGIGLVMFHSFMNFGN
jgi:hypothetical protein